MSITFRVAGELLGEVPIEAFDALYGFDALLEEKTGKYVDLYGKTILYGNDIKWLLIGIEAILKSNKNAITNANTSKLLHILSSIDGPNAIHIQGE